MNELKANPELVINNLLAEMVELNRKNAILSALVTQLQQKIADMNDAV